MGRLEPDSAYTLPELLIVVAIAGILAAISIPVISGMVTRVNVSGTAQNVKSALLLARSRAQANPRVHCGVHFDFNDKVMRVFSDDNENKLYDSGSDELVRTFDTPSSKIEFFLPASNPIQNNVVVFRGDGSAKNGGSIGVQNASGSIQKTISVTRATGKVSIQQ